MAKMISIHAPSAALASHCLAGPLAVKPALHAEGDETGCFEIQAGGMWMAATWAGRETLPAGAHEATVPNAATLVQHAAEICAGETGGDAAPLRQEALNEATTFAAADLQTLDTHMLLDGTRATPASDLMSISTSAPNSSPARCYETH